MATINPFQGPINYAVDVQSPFEAAIGGFKLGAGVAEVEAAKAVRDQALKAQTDLKALFNNPNATSADYERAVAFLPKDQAAIVTQGFERKTKEQQQTALTQGTQVYTAIKSGNLQVAEMQLKEQAVALRNSGREKEAQGYDDLSNLIRLNPTGAQTTIALTIAGLPGGKDFLESADKALSTQRAESLQPSALKEAVAKAEKAVSDAIVAKETATNAPAMQKAEADLKTAQAEEAKVKAEFARAKTVLEVQQQAATLRKTDADILIAKENARIAALIAEQAKETNVLRRKELQQKIDDAKEKRDAADRDQKATVSNQSADIDNFLNTATRILQTPKDVIASATGPVASRLPTLSGDVADFEALVEALGSQAFIAQIPKIKGTGSLSEKEGDKLQASLQTLSLKQSPARLEENVKEAVRLLTKVRENIAVKYGVQAPPLDVPAGELNVTVGGVTYNFPTKAAADAFKNTDAYRRAAGTR